MSKNGVESRESSEIEMISDAILSVLLSITDSVVQLLSRNDTLYRDELTGLGVGYGKYGLQFVHCLV